MQKLTLIVFSFEWRVHFGELAQDIIVMLCYFYSSQKQAAADPNELCQ